MTDPTPIEHARAIVAGYVPRDAHQERERARILAFLAEHPVDGLRRECVPGHLTASALLVDAARERVLLHHHAKLGRWLQFGGHADGDGDLRRVAWRETVEESGIVPSAMSEGPIDLDIHTIPARAARPAQPGQPGRPAEPEHLHLDVRYLAYAPPGAVGVRSEESHALRWLSWDEAAALPLDESVWRLLRLAQER